MQEPPLGTALPSGTPSRPDEPLPEAREVVPGIWKFTLPIPFPLRTVNMYALTGKDGWTLVDAGMGTPDARAALTAALQRAELSIKNLRTIVLTHHHPDHVGLSGELQEQSGARVYMHPIDEVSTQIIWSGAMPDRFGRVSHFLRQHGLPLTELWFSQVDPKVMYNIIRVPPHEAFTLVEDRQYIDLAGERYRVIWTPGHSDGHICLFRERDGVFLAADHVLPRITPNIGLYSPYDRQNPLGDYLDSLKKVSTLPASIVLPGHGEPFIGLATRVREIIEHHGQRLFGSRLKSNEARRMGVAETLSHLEYRRLEGKVEQHHTTDGLILYTVV